MYILYITLKKSFYILSWFNIIYNYFQFLIHKYIVFGGTIHDITMWTNHALS